MCMHMYVQMYAFFISVLYNQIFKFAVLLPQAVMCLISIYCFRLKTVCGCVSPEIITNYTCEIK